MPARNARFCGMVNVHWGGGVRPAPVCTSAETGVLVSSSCYHGFERVPQTLTPVSNHVPMELDYDASAVTHSTPPAISRKRSGDDSEAPRVKRLREGEKLLSLDPRKRTEDAAAGKLHGKAVGALDLQAQSVFSRTHPHQPRRVSLPHGAHDLDSDNSARHFRVATKHLSDAVMHSSSTEHKENMNYLEIEKRDGAEPADRARKEQETELEQMLWSTHGASWFQLQATTAGS